MTWEQVTTLLVAIFMSGFASTIMTRRKVSQHGDEEMHGFDAVHTQMKHMVQMQGTTNELLAHNNKLLERRVFLLEKRLDRVEVGTYSP